MARIAVERELLGVKLVYKKVLLLGRGGGTYGRLLLGGQLEGAAQESGCQAKSRNKLIARSHVSTSNQPRPSGFANS